MQLILFINLNSIKITKYQYDIEFLSNSFNIVYMLLCTISNMYYIYIIKTFKK